MVLDPQVKALLEQMETSEAPTLEHLPPVQAREAFHQLNENLDANPEPVHNVEDRTIPGPEGTIPIRVYTPEGDGPHPALVFFHGGGWVIGDVNSHDNVCRSLCNLANCVVISVDYRLAPEHPFPAAVDDCYACTKWLFEHPEAFNVDSSRIAVGGDSAGGNLAAVITHLSKQRGTPAITYQVLIYPATHFSYDTESHRENGEGYFLTKDAMTYFRNHYLNTAEDAQNPLASPLLFEDFTDLPSATVITAEYDPLRDEGEAYAYRLIRAGIPVNIKRYEGMIHGFVSMAGQLDQGKAALQHASLRLRNTFKASRIQP